MRYLTRAEAEQRRGSTGASGGEQRRLRRRCCKVEEGRVEAVRVRGELGRVECLLIGVEWRWRGEGAGGRGVNGGAVEGSPAPCAHRAAACAARRRDTTAGRRPLQAALCRGRRCCAASTAVGRGVTRTGWRRVRVRARARAHDVAAALERLGCSRAQASGSGRRCARRGGHGLGTAGARAAVGLPCSASACGRGGVELVRAWRRPGGRARWGGKEGRAGGARERQSREGGGIERAG